ncbi:MAG: radical SAM protein [Candidatus Thermoplasmatota archaeon]
MSEVRRMKMGSAYTGRLPEGCVLCEKGAKMVLLVTGRCARRCCYCPLSAQKKGRDVFFANERRVRTVGEALDEAALMDALGTGITGGDPLIAVQRTADSIRALKERFGPEHHIHLYTSTTDTGRIGRVARAGLDEIRFHPPAGLWTRLEGSDFAKALRFSKRKGMATGLEVPALPGRGKELAALVRSADALALDFVNLNELEFSETNWKALRAAGSEVKDDVSSAVLGSEGVAMGLLRSGAGVPLHYCSSSFKDGVQLRRRIARRARNVRRPHELLTRDGTLLKGVVETDDPEGVAGMLIMDHDVPPRLMCIDEEKGRLEVAAWVLEELAPQLGLDSYMVEEYPTADRLEVERRPLRRR